MVVLIQTAVIVDVKDQTQAVRGASVIMAADPRGLTPRGSMTQVIQVILLREEEGGKSSKGDQS